MNLNLLFVALLIISYQNFSQIKYYLSYFSKKDKKRNEKFKVGTSGVTIIYTRKKVYQVTFRLSL